MFGIRPGVTELSWDSWPRIDDAIAGYRAFKADFAADYPLAERAFGDLVARELKRLTEVIPPGDLAIQWDMTYETQDLEGVLAWTGEGGWSG